MLFASLVNEDTKSALIATLSFNEAKLRVISGNLANVSTPGFRARQLDARAFQQALRSALHKRDDHPDAPLHIEDHKQLDTRPDGTLQVTADVRPVENILSHDGTNVSIEREMSDLAETGMMHELASALLRRSFEGLEKAIRGTV